MPIQKLIAKFQDMRQQSKNNAAFTEALLGAATDGKITIEEVRELEGMRADLKIPDDVIGKIRLQVYNRAFAAVVADREVTQEEEEELEHLKSYLGIPEADIERSQATMNRYRILREIQEGRVDPITLNGLVVTRGEKALWVEGARYLEERVVSRRYEGGSQGISFRIAKGVSYRIGGVRGKLVSETDIVEVSSGEFVVTTQRLIFRGDRKSFTLKFDKLLNLGLYSDGITITGTTGKPRHIKLLNPANAEVVGAIISYAMNQ